MLKGTTQHFQQVLAIPLIYLHDTYLLHLLTVELLIPYQLRIYHVLLLSLCPAQAILFHTSVVLFSPPLNRPDFCFFDSLPLTEVQEMLQLTLLQLPHFRLHANILQLPLFLSGHEPQRCKLQIKHPDIIFVLLLALQINHMHQIIQLLLFHEYMPPGSSLVLDHNSC